MAIFNSYVSLPEGNHHQTCWKAPGGELRRVDRVDLPISAHSMGSIDSLAVAMFNCVLQCEVWNKKMKKKMINLK